MVERPVKGNSHMIERPRLTDMLDATKARAMLLIAPAGYGKTTLSRQWFGRGERPVVRYRATQASSDVAALAAGLARAAEPLVPGAGDRLLPVIRSSPAPARDVEDIADVLVEALRPFPVGGWIAFDDYHFLVGSAPAERLIEVLADRGAARLLISSRRRPSWATARRTLYGEIDEAAQADLAFTVEEAALLLPHIPPLELSRFVERAKGWPAVIRLASVSGGKLPELEVPPALHQYFAEELFQAANSAMQDALVRLALLPTLQPRLLELAVGVEYRTVCKEAVGLGFLTEDGEGNFDFHPLLRAFLAPRARRMHEAAPLGEQLAETLIADGSWDDAFAVISSLQRLDMLSDLFGASLDELLTESRVSTLENWVASATQAAAAFPLLDLAEAEIARRLGHLEVGEVRALQAARTFDRRNRFASRAWAVAGECAHLSSRPTEALRYHEQAEKSALNARDARRAVWGQHVVEIHFGVGNPDESLRRMRALDDGSPLAAVRAATGELNLVVMRGGFERAVAEARRHTHLLPRISDPLVTTSFLVRLGWACIMAGQYQLGGQYAEAGVTEAEKTRATFAVIHFIPLRIAAGIGLRRFRHARILIDDLIERSRASSNAFEEFNAQIFSARLNIALGSPQSAAIDLDIETLAKAPTPALHLEAVYLRALALSVDGDAGKALGADETESSVESECQVVVLGAFVRAIQAAAKKDPDAQGLVASATQLASATQSFDSFVQAYRAYPPLLRFVLDEHLLPVGKLTSILRSSMDFALAAKAGLILEAAPTRHHSLLTPRERHVYELLCKGLSNREIADVLVISESTAKVHVRHILDKLDVKTRMQAMLAAQETF